MQNQISRILKHPKTIFIGTLVVAVLLRTSGYCDDADNAAKAMDETSTSIQHFLFGPTIRKAALTLGLGAGLFQAFMSGSIRPLLIYGGLGLAVCYLPKVVNWISTVS